MLINKQKVYFISGLGANSKTFSFLQLNFCTPIFVQWIAPLRNETLEKYAIRLFKESIKDEAAIIVGLSFGGMLTTEICKQYPLVKGILISSNKTSDEFPFWLKIGKYFPAYKYSPKKWAVRYNPMLHWFLGDKKPTTTKLLKEILAKTDVTFTRWAIEAIMHWENKIAPANIKAVHGTADKLLPYRFVRNAKAVKGGTHLMIMDESEMVSNFLKETITKY